MQQSRNEEEAAALLLSTADNDDDDDDDDHHHNTTSIPLNTLDDNSPVVKRNRKTFKNRSASSIHPLVCFAFILGAFVIGCISGVIIILYGISQAARPESSSLPSSGFLPLANADLTIRAKLFQSIRKTSFRNLNR